MTEPSDAERLRCFVIGPIGNKFAELGTDERTVYEEAIQVWEEVIEPACATVGLVPVRADGLARPGEIPDQIFRRLRDDDVVIADLTGANANVMYELGLRHTRDMLTVQVGEYGRLPFDVTVIRTVQFSRSTHGLIKARDELIPLLRAGLAGQWDPVSATRVWGEEERAATSSESLGGEEGLPNTSDLPGFLDLVAEGEERQGQFIEAMEAINREIVAMGTLAVEATAEMERSDASGGGMRGRLAVTTRFASGLGAIAQRLEQHVGEYEDAMHAISSANLAIIARLEEDPSQLPDVLDYGMVTRRLAETAREGLGSLGGMTESMESNARLSRVLRDPTQRITMALDRFASATQNVDEWDRRLQSLGVPVPPADWEPEENGDEPGSE